MHAVYYVHYEDRPAARTVPMPHGENLMAEAATIYALVKLFEKRQYAEEFVRGSLFMHSLAYFREYRDEHGELRGDKYEGIRAIFQPSQIGDIRVRDALIEPKELAEPAVLLHERLDHKMVYCMYALNSRGFDRVSAANLAALKRVLRVHRACYGLGNVAAVVTNVTIFIERVINAIKAANLWGQLGLIDYFDETQYHGEFQDKPGFHKRKLYADQREYRIKVDLPIPSAEAYRLNVGDLSDIVHLTTPDDFNRDIKISLPDGSSV